MVRSVTLPLHLMRLVSRDECVDIVVSIVPYGCLAWHWLARYKPFVRAHASSSVTLVEQSARPAMDSIPRCSSSPSPRSSHSPSTPPSAQQPQPPQPRPAPNNPTKPFPRHWRPTQRRKNTAPPNIQSPPSPPPQSPPRKASPSVPQPHHRRRSLTSK